jgi:hypothetical protein
MNDPLRPTPGEIEKAINVLSRWSTQDRVDYYEAGNIILRAYCASDAKLVALQKELEAARGELSDKNTVPRSRYDVASKQYSECEELRQKQNAVARERFIELEAANNRLRAGLEYIATNGKLQSGHIDCMTAANAALKETE